MTFEEFDQALLRPLYVYRMAHAMVVIEERARYSPPNLSMLASARTRQANAQKEIDQLVAERYATMKLEGVNE